MERQPLMDPEGISVGDIWKVSFVTWKKKFVLEFLKYNCGK